MYDIAKRCVAEAPITVGIHPGHDIDGIRCVEPISDILSIHPYWTCDTPPLEKTPYETFLDRYLEFAESVGKCPSINYLDKFSSVWYLLLA